MSGPRAARQGRMAGLVAGCLAAAALALVPAAEAAFPGSNGRIAFVNETGGGNTIFSINPDGSTLLPLSDPLPGQHDDDPAWSADGTQIVFTRDLGGGVSQVWVMNADGSGEMRLTDGDGDCDPYFLPDGRVVFVRSAMFCPEGGDIFIRLDSTTYTNLTPGSADDDFTPTSAPSGQAIAFARGGSAFVEDSVIFTVSSGGGAATPVTGDHGQESIIDTSPNYSPDGGTIAFDRCPGGEGCDPGGVPMNLARVPAGGGAVALTTANMVVGSDPDACQPAYAPDGTRLVFTQLTTMDFPTNCRPLGPSTTSFGLALIGPLGGAVQSFVTGFAPDWQPVAATSTPPGGAGAGAAVDVAGSPPPRCFGEDVTTFGTHRNDKLVGTPGPDVIRGFRGRDKMNGLGDGDILCGGRGRDKLFGKKGDDILIGGAQSDFLNGGPGINRLFGGTPGAPFEKATNVCVLGANDTESNCQVIK